MGLDPMEASGPDVATWLVYRSEQTTSPNMVESDLNAVKCFCKHANKPISEIPLVTAVKKGLLKIMEAKDLNHLGLEPEHAQVLIYNAICQFGPQNFVGLCRAALYAIMYWGTARVEEVRELEIRQIVKKEASYEIKIHKDIVNQTRKLQKGIIHPNALQ